MTQHAYTYIDLEDGEYAKSCNDCGAHVLVSTKPSSTPVKHHASCTPGCCEEEMNRIDEMHMDEDPFDLPF